MALKEMCEELGCLDHYLTIYRGASELAHGGAHGLGEEMLGLVEGQQLPEYKLPFVLLTAVTYHKGAWGFVAKCSPVWLRSSDLTPCGPKSSRSCRIRCWKQLVAQLL